VVSCNPLPSAARRLSSGTVKPFGFFQLLTGGGILQASWSAAVSFLGGECMTGGGGEGGPRGIFLCRNFGGSIGSSCLSTILMILSFFFELSPIWLLGVYRT